MILSGPTTFIVPGILSGPTAFIFPMILIAR
jgi:hypothetical protein